MKNSIDFLKNAIGSAIGKFGPIQLAIMAMLTGFIIYLFFEYIKRKKKR